MAAWIGVHSLIVRDSRTERHQVLSGIVKYYFFKWTNLGVFFIYFGLFRQRTQYYNKSMCEKCHFPAVYGAKI